MSVESPWSRQVVFQLSNLGIEVHVMDFAKPQLESYLDRSLHAGEIKTLEQAIGGTHYISTLCQNNFRHFEAIQKIRTQCKNNQIDVLLTLYGGGLAMTAYLSGIRPYAIFAVGSDVLGLTGMRRIIGKASFLAAKIVFTNGTYLTKETRILAPGAHVEPLLLGIDTDRFVLGRKHTGPIRIICSRGFLPVYNNEYIVRGLAAIKDSVPDFTLSFLSGGVLLTTVKVLAKNMLSPSMMERVRFLGGVTDQELLDHFQSGDIFVSVSKSDGTATSMLEAMACGLFPVLSDIPPNREWVDPAVGNGLLVPLNDPVALAGALLRAMSDKALREKAAVINRGLVLERASSRRNMAYMAERLESLI